MMQAFHGDPAIKDKYLARVAQHQADDQIVKGIYWERGKGCAVGCTLHSANHESYETELGIPQMLARLEDGIFEGMPPADAKLFPHRFLSAIPVGADLSLIGWQFLSWSVEISLKRYGTREIRDGCKAAVTLLRAMAKGKPILKSAAAWSAESARSAAESARSAAWSARSAARSAESAAWSAESAARSAESAAAWSAESAESAAAWSAWSAESAESAESARNEQGEKLLELLAAAPVPA